MKRRSKTKPDNLVPNNPAHDRDTISPAEKRERTKEKADTLYDNLNPFQKKILEIYGGRYGYRQTASGRWRERDEPDQDTELKQADAIRKAASARQALQSKERLKKANKVPIRKDGRKVFEEFCREAGIQRKISRKLNIKTTDLENIYNSARAVEYDLWFDFIMDEYGKPIQHNENYNHFTASFRKAYQSNKAITFKKWLEIIEDLIDQLD